jgi:hypothetical protein
MCLIFILEIIQRKSDKVGSMSQTCLGGATFKYQPEKRSLFCLTISVVFLSPFRKPLFQHLKFAKGRLFPHTSQFKNYFFFNWRNSPPPQWARASSFTTFLDHTTTHHNRQYSSGRVITSSQSPLLDNTQHLQQTDIHATAGIRIHNLSG